LPACSRPNAKRAQLTPSRSCLKTCQDGRLIGGARRTLFLSFGQYEWGEIHTWLAYLSVALLVVHFLLNWQWLVKSPLRKHVWRLAAGILAGLFIVGAFLLLPVEKFAQNDQENIVHLQVDR
jgi:Domain of unknown function (DUF4405)